MTFFDSYSEKTYSIPDLKKDWDYFRQEEPYNHSDNFRTEFFEILMATVNGRNDLDIIGLTPNEISNYIIKLRSQIIK